MQKLRVKVLGPASLSTLEGQLVEGVIHTFFTALMSGYSAVMASSDVTRDAMMVAAGLGKPTEDEAERKGRQDLAEQKARDALKATQEFAKDQFQGVDLLIDLVDR